MRRIATIMLVLLGGQCIGNIISPNAAGRASAGSGQMSIMIVEQRMRELEIGEDNFR
jgi:hypothetical protein